MPRAANSSRSSSMKIPWPDTSSSVPSGHSGRPPLRGSELVTHTPIEGLPSYGPVTRESVYLMR